MEPILRVNESVDWITILLFGSLLFPIVAKTFYYDRFINFIILPFNNKYIFMYGKKENLFNRFHVLLTIFQIINTALFLYLAYKTFNNAGNETFLYFIIFIGVFIFLALKTILPLGNGFIFNHYDIFNEIVFKKTTYLNYSGIILFVSNIMLVFIFPNSSIVIYATLVLFLFINLIGWLTVIKNHQKLISNYFFYFILYLCALEIAPLIILGSFLK